MMRIAGRNTDGIAKPIKTDKDGQVIVSAIPRIKKNIFNKDDVTVGSYLNSTGALITASGWVTSNFISVTSGKSIIIKTLPASSVAGVGIYADSELITWLSNDVVRSNGQIVNIPPNANRIKVSMVDSSLINQQIEYGTVSTEYEPYEILTTFETSSELLALNDDNKTVKLSAIQNPETQKYYLGVVNPAPVAYDAIWKRLKVESRLQKSIIMADLSRTVSLNATNGFAQIVMNAPVGELWHIRDIFFSVAAISGATTGTHKLAVIQGNHFMHGERLSFVTAYNKALVVSKNMASASVDTPDPSEKLLQVQSIKSLIVQNGNDTLLQFVYYNNSNVAQTDVLITCKVWYEREYVL